MLSPLAFPAARAGISGRDSRGLFSECRRPRSLRKGCLVPSIPLPSDGELPEPVANRLARLPALNIFRLLALVPECFGPWVDLVNGIYETGIDPRLREIAICRYGARTHAPYELFQHTPLARQQHVSPAELEAILHAETVDSLDDAANFTCGVVDEFEDTASLSEPARAELLARFG